MGQFPVVAVTWFDAVNMQCTKIEDIVHIDPPKVRTYGELIYMDDRKIVLGYHVDVPTQLNIKTDDGGDLFVIPATWVQQITYLEPTKGV